MRRMPFHRIRSGRGTVSAARVTLLLLALVTVTSSARAQDSAFSLRTEMIAMRDGVKLNTKIFVPRGSNEALPILFVRTPYGIGGWSSRAIETNYKELVADGYVFVSQDIRGRYGSEGEFVMIRPPRTDRRDPKAIDESTDTYDTIEWVLKNVPNNNGKVGMFGVSYPGWLTVMAVIDPHPALKAASPQASPADMWMGDDFHHNGAFRLSYGFEYAAMMEGSRDQRPFTFDRYDTFDWYLELGSLSNVNKKYLNGKVPTWNDFVAHPDYDAFWKRRAAEPYLTRVAVPTLHVAGWWDQEDFRGPLKIYETLEKRDSANMNFLVVGPWNHGGWSRGEGRKLGNVDFGSATSQHYREKIQAPFFAYHLKGKGTLRQPEAITFEAGGNEWREHATWPPKNGVTPRKLFFHPNERLSFDVPSGANADAFDSYVSDPANPVPYRQRPIQATYDRRGSGWGPWQTEDQRFVDDRPDVLSWETEPLTEDVSIAGALTVKLFAATTGSDADWVVKLIDVYPDSGQAEPKMNGYQLMVAADVFRARYNKSFEKPQPLVPGKPTEFTIDLLSQNYKFKKGHRIMVQVQSSWFPVIDRNPQTFVPNIFEAKESDFRKATQRVYRSASLPSHIVLPVVNRVAQ
jgi:uncharacterized protein